MSLATALRRAALGCRKNFQFIVSLLVFALCVTPTQAVEPNGAPFNGTLPGEFGVSPTGAATYSIPVEVPPGIGGMQPNLSLEYNSQSGNGLLGVGWSLGGLSAIMRCPATLAQDGFIDGVDFDGNDRFCLDGQRLVAIAGPDGADGTEYRTEIDNVSKITSIGNVANSPLYFIVKTKAGQTFEYGSTTDSRVEAQGKSDVLAWMLYEVRDTQGNMMRVTYTEDYANGEHYPTRIDYTKNVLQGVEAYHSVRFVYESRTDVSTAYLAGSKSRTSLRMKNAQVYAGTTLVRDYRLTYDNGSAMSKSRLMQIQGCAAGNVCTSSMSISWLDSGGVAVSSDISTGLDGALNGWSAYPGDYNGDGKTDFFFVETSGAFRKRISLSNGDGTFSGDIATGYDGALNGAEIYPGDYNGDGRTDILFVERTGFYRKRIALSNGDGTLGNDIGTGYDGALNTAEIYPGDYNGDGRTDILFVERSGSYRKRIALSIGDGTLGNDIATGYDGALNTAEVYPADFNGDGRTDVLFVERSSPYRKRIALSNGNGTLANDVATGFDGALNTAQVHLGDYNGDGLTDVLFVESSGLYRKRVAFSKGDGTLTADVATGYDGALGGWDVHVGDYNGDGISDVFFAETNNSFRKRIALSRGDGTLSNDYSVGLDGSFPGWNVEVADFDGDGRADLFLDENKLYYRKRVVLSLMQRPSILAGLEEAFGSTHTVEYKPLTDPSVYTKYTGSQYPNVDLQSSMLVVSSISSDDGVGGRRTNRYSYEGLKANLQGRGLLGFRKTRATDDQTGIVSSTVYRQDFPYVGLVESTDTRLVNVQSPLGTTSNTWGYSQFSSGVYQMRAGTTTEHTYEPNGTLVSTVTTENQQYDAYGNPLRIVITSTGNNETYTKTTVNSYDNDTALWHLGRLTSATVTSTTPSGTETRTSAFEYHPTTGLLTAEIVEPYDPQLMLRTEYGYDAYGNKTSVTVRDSGSNSYPIAAATSSTSYDYSQLTVNGTYTITSANAKGHTETQVIDARFGKPLSLTGPNGLTTQWQYDGFGRQIREIRADGTETATDMVWCDSNCAGVANAVYKVTSQTTGSAPTSAYFDGLGRELRSEALSLDGRTLYKDTQYNALGQVARVSRPYFASTTPHWTDYQYDTIGRVWKETSPDGGIVETTYNGLSTSLRRYSVNDSYDQTVTRINNVEGNLVQVIDEDYQTTNYEYDPFGNLTRVTDPANNATVMTYDKRGRKTAMDDPDMGHWEYRYDALGQLRWQQDAKGQIVTMSYDLLGRMTSRVEPEGTSSWLYDTSPTKGIGKLWRVNGPNGYVQNHYYDDLGRPVRVRDVIAGSTFNTYTAYDAFGRVDRLTYPSGFILKHGYNGNGYLDSISNGSNASEIYWTALAASPEGQVSLEQLGNGLRTVRTFDPASGRLTYLTTGTGSGSDIQNLFYRYDALGNLQERTDVNLTLAESFSYDAFNRLASATVAGVGTKTWAYDGLGNITSKDGYTDYAYGSAGTRPHAVTAARGNSYSYDANGNMESGAGRTITWNSANLPTRIVRGSAVAEFSYGPDRARYQQVAVSGGVTTTTLYVGKLYERTNKNGVITHKNYIAAGGRTVAIRETTNGTATTKYLHQDHLGSTDVITDATGQVLERQSFDAFGARRVATTWHDPVAALTSLFSTRGYTGHEQLDNVGLIHMNGRVYDPELGRFISADPMVKYPAGAQGLNRYSYVDNNPLSRVDPSGYGWLSKTWKKVKKWVKPIAAAIAAYYTFGWAAIMTSGNLVAAGALSGFVGGAIATGTFKGALAGTVIGGITGGIAQGIFGGSKHFVRSAFSTGNAISGAAFNQAAGAKWQQGFFSGWAFTYVNYTPWRNLAAAERAGVIGANAVAGGASSRIGGGSFADGAHMSGGIAFLSYVNWEFRDYIVNNKNANRDNWTGISTGHEGDHIKTGGSRMGYVNGELVRGSPQLGGNQSGRGSFFGFLPYDPGSRSDWFVESFGGVHDTFNSFMYDAAGNTKSFWSAGVGGQLGNVISAVNVIPAAPFAVSGMLRWSGGGGGYMQYMYVDR